MAVDATAPRRRRRLLTLVAALVVAGGAAALAVTLLGGSSQRPLVAAGQPARTLDPLAYRPELDADLTRRATAGYSHVLYAKSPGGVLATARRTAAWRPQVERAAARSDGGVDADTLEAIVFLESGGRPDVIAGGPGAPAGAASGLTQIVAETGQSLLGMRVDLARSRRLTRRARREAARHHPRAAATALRVRRRIDQRFDPAAALAGAVRYLNFARERLGRDDLAVVSYHMGIGNLQAVLRRYGGGQPSYVRVFFDSTPLRHAAAWRLLSSFGDDSSTYWWRVLAAKEIMRLYRHDPAELNRLDELQTNKASAEEVLHPQLSTEVFADPAAVSAARQAGKLAPLPARLGFRIDRRMGELAPRLGQRPELYRALRPAALAVAGWMAPTVARISRVATPLIMTSAVRDQRYQDLLTVRNVEATSGYSLHTTGYAFDVLRRYRSKPQAVAFQFALDRLQALNLIAWVREPAAIHVTAASDAATIKP
jgi:hypothetical protein